MKNTLKAAFLIGLGFGLLPIGVHLIVAIFLPHAHFGWEELYIDLLLFAVATAITGFVDGIKLLGQGGLGGSYNLWITLLVGIFPLGITCVAFMYAFALAHLFEFSWMAWLANLIMIALFCCAAFFVSVVCAANLHLHK